LATGRQQRHERDGHYTRFDDAHIHFILAMGTLSDSDYQRLSAELLTGIEAQVDRWLQDDVIDIDAARTGGLLELAFPNGSKIIVNTQPPLQEIWLAARAGGYHFRHQQGRWVDTKDGREFYDRLNECASAQGAKPLRFAAA
jgi:CyaY protein